VIKANIIGALHDFQASSLKKALLPISLLSFPRNPGL